MQKGNIRVQTENIFPIIKKFLYSDHEIFLRELVSNAIDATQKLKTLSSIGEAKGDLGELRIDVTLDAEKKTLTISDRGVGMTGEEVDKYLNQLAFSGAEEFLEKYKGQNENNIIGHFGLLEHSMGGLLGWLTDARQKRPECFYCLVACLSDAWRLKFQNIGVFVCEELTRAIALYLVQCSGRRYSTLFSDEADGALDPERKRRFMAMKREVLKLGGYEREYYVSQTPELAAMADAVRLVAAWCELRKDFRSFRTDRVVDADYLDEKYPERRDVLRAKWRQSMVWQQPKEP